MCSWVFRLPPGNTLGGRLDGRGKERAERKQGLFGEDQLVLAGDAQQVALAGMIDFKCRRTAQQLLAIDAEARACRRRRGGLNRGWLCMLFHLDMDANEN